jgi:hypothetical protein
LDKYFPDGKHDQVPNFLSPFPPMTFSHKS